MSEHPRIARVRPDSRVPQLDREFDYRIPPGMTVEPGVRVRVPMGRGSRVSSGIVTALVDHSDYAGKLGDIEEVISDVVVVPHEMSRLLEEVAVRHAGGVSDVLRLALPARSVRVENAWRQREVPPRQLPTVRTNTEIYEPEAWDGLAARGAKTWCELPYGVNGTGVLASDEVLANLATHTLAGGHSVVLVVPDWRDLNRLRPMLLERVGEQFLAVFDSDSTPSERYRAYLRCLEDDPVIVLGARHAVYAPVAKLGLLIVHNDADDAHREPLAPYPHTRDIALIRAEQTGAALCLTSLVPSIAVQRLRQMGYFDSCRLIRQTRPRVIPTSLALNSEQGAGQARIPSMAYTAIRDALRAGPVLVQVFRSGYSPGLACSECGDRARCTRCDGPLVARKGRLSGQCGWCGEMATTWSCSACKATSHRPIGYGVGRTISELGKAFPGARVIQADGDHPITSVSNAPALVVATRAAEPVADGGYAAVLLLDGQSMLQRPSLNAMTETIEGWEWALSLLRSDAQAYITDIDGPVVSSFASGMYQDLLGRELTHRQELNLPPASKLAVVEADAATMEKVLTVVANKTPGVSVLGPVSGPGLSSRVILTSSYQEAPSLARELRAVVVAQSVARKKGSSRMKVSFDAQSALDDFGLDAQ